MWKPPHHHSLSLPILVEKESNTLLKVRHLCPVYSTQSTNATICGAILVNSWCQGTP